MVFGVIKERQDIYAVPFFTCGCKQHRSFGQHRLKYAVVGIIETINKNPGKQISTSHLKKTMEASRRTKKIDTAQPFRREVIPTRYMRVAVSFSEVSSYNQLVSFGPARIE